jgi:DNA adenine methylase
MSEESARELFLKSKESINNEDISNFDRAVAFYVVNKCSFSGLTESSSFSKMASMNNFTMRGIDKLPGYSKIIEHWRITNYSYDYLLGSEGNAFVYLDPPYDIKDNLYGRKVSYNSDQLVKDRFKDWKAAEFDLTYTLRSVGEYMREQKQRKELLLFNYEMPSNIV